MNHVDIPQSHIVGVVVRLSGDVSNKKYIVTSISKDIAELRLTGSTKMVKIATVELQTVIPVSPFIELVAILTGRVGSGR